MESGAMVSPEAKCLATSSSKARVNLKYAPSRSMFSQQVGKDPVEHLKCIADQGFRAAFDLGMVNRPPEQQEKIANEAARLGLEMGQFSLKKIGRASGRERVCQYV